MPPSERLEELKRQRALLLEHLEWLEREIAGAGDGAIAPGRRASIPAKANPAPSARPDLPADGTGDPELVLRQFGAEPENPADVKRGCLTLFIGGMVATAAALGLVYYFFYR